MYSLTVLEAWSSKCRCGQGWLLGEGLFQASPQDSRGCQQSLASEAHKHITRLSAVSFTELSLCLLCSSLPGHLSLDVRHPDPRYYQVKILNVNLCRHLSQRRSLSQAPDGHYMYVYVLYIQFTFNSLQWPTSKWLLVSLKMDLSALESHWKGAIPTE